MKPVSRDRAHNNSTWLDEVLNGTDTVPTNASAPLSNREHEILLLAAKGVTDKEIAVQLTLSMGTVRTYWERMRKKTGAKNRAEVMASVFEQLYAGGSEKANAVESLFTNLLENSSLGFAILDKCESQVLYVNKVIRDLFESKPHMFSRSGLDGAPLVLDQVLLEIADEAADFGSGELSDYDRYYNYFINEFHSGGKNLTLIQIAETTKIRAAVLAVSRSARMFRELLSSSSEALLVLSRRGTILYASEAVARLVGRDIKDLVGRNIDEIAYSGEKSTSKISSMGLRGDAKITVTFKGADGRMYRVAALTENRLHDPAIRGIAISLIPRLS